MPHRSGNSFRSIEFTGSVVPAIQQIEGTKDIQESSLTVPRLICFCDWSFCVSKAQTVTLYLNMVGGCIRYRPLLEVMEPAERTRLNRRFEVLPFWFSIITPLLDVYSPFSYV